MERVELLTELEQRFNVVPSAIHDLHGAAVGEAAGANNDRLSPSRRARDPDDPGGDSAIFAHQRSGVWRIAGAAPIATSPVFVLSGVRAAPGRVRV
jgi:hypothetical protein